LLSKLGQLVDHVQSPKDLQEAMGSATTAGAAVDEIAVSVPDTSDLGTKRDEVRGSLPTLSRRTEVAGHEVRLLGLCIPSVLLKADGSIEDKPSDANVASRLIDNLHVRFIAYSSYYIFFLWYILHFTRPVPL
jgi:hypothetical protein